jgi:hypothetical protein
VRKTTLIRILESLPAVDRDEVQLCIADLILAQTVFSDIAVLPYSLGTELSVFENVDGR